MLFHISHTKGIPVRDIQTVYHMFSNSQSGHRSRLKTCEGTWISLDHSLDRRLHGSSNSTNQLITTAFSLISSSFKRILFEAPRIRCDFVERSPVTVSKVGLLELFLFADTGDRSGRCITGAGADITERPCTAG